MASPNKTRTRTNVYLVGTAESDISGTSLPLCGQVLSFFMYNLKTLEKSIPESAKLTVQKCIQIWNQTEKPITNETNLIQKVKRLYGQWLRATKNKIRNNSSAQKDLESAFKKQLDKVFEMRQEKAKTTPPSELELIVIPKQTTQSKSCNKKREEKKYGRKQNKVSGNKNSSIANNLLNYELPGLTTECETAEETDANVSEDEFRPSVSTEKKKKIQILDRNLCSTLDRTKTSTREATYIVAATVQSVGVSIREASLSKSTVHRKRNESRKAVALGVENEFAVEIKKNEDVKLVVQWDGKLLPDVKGKDIDCLPILVKGDNIDHLLGVGKLERGTGENQAKAILELLQKCKISKNIVGLCFDTTAVNTGNRSGTCAVLERNLNRKLLHLACRHHVLEVVLRAVFDTTMGATSGPDVGIFKRFQTAWKNNGINTSEFNHSLDDSKIHMELKKNKDQLIHFATTIYQEKYSRDDYKELIELIIIFLGGVPNGQKICFKKPGAFHHARWMAKALYSIKIYLFRNQFELTYEELHGVRQISQFIVLFYQKVWFTAGIIEQAPFNDLTFLQDLANCKAISANIRKVALHKFINHLWYLNQDLVGLAFFDNRLSLECKKKMVHAIKCNASYLQPNNRAVIDSKKRTVHFLTKLTLDKFVTIDTMQFFTKLGIKTDFLDTDPQLWNERDDFNNGMKIIKSLPCTNDNAERAVQLASTFNSLITKDEKQKQDLYKVVRQHRKIYPDSNKKTLDACTAKKM